MFVFGGYDYSFGESPAQEIPRIRISRDLWLSKVPSPIQTTLGFWRVSKAGDMEFWNRFFRAPVPDIPESWIQTGAGTQRSGGRVNKPQRLDRIAIVHSTIPNHVLVLGCQQICGDFLSTYFLKEHIFLVNCQLVF